MKSKSYLLMLGIFLALILISTIGSAHPAKDNSTKDHSSLASTPASTASLVGVWQEMCNMGFEIKDNQLIEYDDVEAKKVTFAGNIVNSPDLTQPNGLIVIQITYPHATKNKYTVVRWKNFTGDQAGQTYAQVKNDNGKGYKPVFYDSKESAAALAEASDELSHFCCNVSKRH